MGGAKQGQGQVQGQGQAKGGKSAANRDEVQKQLAALRERAAAKSFKKAPEPKVVLAAPLFHLPTKQELLLQPQQHPMDLLLFDEAPKESGQQARLKKSIPQQQQQQQQPITLHPGFLSHIRHNGDPDEDL